MPSKNAHGHNSLKRKISEMIHGMTGFGSTEFTHGKVKGSLDIKSLNHRYLDVGYFLPMGFASIENKIRDLIAKDIERGRVTITIKLTNKSTPSVSFNKEVIRTYLKDAKMLQKDFGLKGELTLDRLIQLPGVVETRETFLSPEDLWPTIEKSLRVALKSLVHMRQREGKSLVSDIDRLLNLMLLQINKIRSRSKIILKDKKKLLTNEEFMSFQKGADINEELSRLAHHIEEFKILLRSDMAVGKKLDFIAQEMQRETNTVGSKLQDKVVSNAVIALKSKVEKIREQSQNIE